MMRDMTIFIELIHQQGYRPEAAQAAISTLEVSLHDYGYSTTTAFYIYRTGNMHGGTGEGKSGERPRSLLAFPAADTALAFAQHNNLGKAPRLLRVTVPQLLAVMVQRPAIQALIFVDESADFPPRGQLPSGLRIDRELLLNMLERGMSHEQSF